MRLVVKTLNGGKPLWHTLRATMDDIDWLALHLKFGSVYFQQFGGISRPHVDQLQI